MGEAAHRLVKNTLNIKLNNVSHGWLEQPYQNIPGHHSMNRHRPAGSSGYGKHYGEDTSSYYGHYNNHQGIMSRPRFPISSSGGHNDRQNFRTQDRSHYQEQFHNVKTGFSAMTMEEGVRSRSSGMVSPVSPGMLTRVPSSGTATNLQHQFVQNAGPPIPPPNWITKAPAMTGIHTRHQEAACGTASEKQVKKVYQVKTRQVQDMPEHGDH